MTNRDDTATTIVPQAKIAILFNRLLVYSFVINPFSNIYIYVMTNRDDTATTIVPQAKIAILFNRLLVYSFVINPFSNIYVPLLRNNCQMDR